jgi:hypothetical protein
MNSWRSMYVVAANTALLIVLLQWGAHGSILGYQFATQRLFTERPPAYAVRALPEMSASEIQDLWRATRWMPFKFAGSAGFVHGQTSSRFVNVDQYGVRSNGGPARPLAHLDNATWVFGGSTSFGFGVPDHQTIPAYLEQLTGAPVFNLAVRGHSSSMENRLFRYYLRAGYRPKQVVFLDGINEVCEPDLFSEQMTRLTQRVQDGYRWEFGEPVVFAFHAVERWLKSEARTQVGEGPHRRLSCDNLGRDNQLGEIVGRVMSERDAVCATDGLPCHTFIQPFGGVHGHHEDRAFVSSHEGRELQGLFRHLEPTWTKHGATFVTGVLDATPSGLWVDEMHYSPVANKLIAAAIAEHLKGLAK